MSKLLQVIFLSQWIVLNGQFWPSCTRNTLCTTRGGNPGRCVPFKDCEFDLSQTIFGSSDSTWRSILRRSSRTGCCPKLQSEPNCGRMKIQDHIYGGVETERDEFPWTAMMYQIDPNTGERYFQCGGTLINGQFVVTAAHCVHGMLLIDNFQLLIRLGAWDRLAVETSVEDYNVTGIFIHEKYSPLDVSKEHDIALIKLSSPAPRTDFIEPICLPTQVDYTLNLEMPLFVTGWGETEKGRLAQRKMKVHLPAKNLTDCQHVFNRTGATFTDNHLCVGASAGKDSCAGDSGGPLMTEINYRAHLVGVVSWGSKYCGRKGVPALYTRFDKYLDWVAARIEDGGWN